MIFELKTLVDITNTNARRGVDPKLIQQQDNFNTVMNTIGLRVNVDIITVDSKIEDVSELFPWTNAKERVWTFLFEVEYAEALNIDMLTSDFDIIPVNVGLDETASNPNKIITTSRQNETNISFKILKDDK